MFIIFKCVCPDKIIAKIVLNIIYLYICRLIKPDKMKKYILSVLLTISTAIALAQSPQAFSYQAIVRDASGNIMSDQNVALRISLLENGFFGFAAYVETHTATTNPYGIVTLQIGQGTPVSGVFANLQWQAVHYFLKIELDVDGGTSYVEMGTTPLQSVPYALYADKAGTTGELSQGAQGHTLRHNGTSWLSDTSLYNDGSKVGVGTASPGGKLEVRGSSSDADDAPLFEVKDKNGNTVMAVYPEGVVVYVKEGGTEDKAGLIVRGRDNEDVNDYMRITSDSIRFYVRDGDDDKASNRGGFAVTGRATNKESENEYFRVTSDSVRIYIDNSTEGGYKGGFGVGGFGASDSLFLQSDKSGFNVVYLTETERDAIANPRLSSMIFNTTDSCLQIYLGYWESIWCTPMGCIYPTVTAQPKDLNAVNTATFTVSASGSKLYYHWQVSMDGGITWQVITDGGTSPHYSGTLKDTLVISNIPISYNNYLYRCLVKNACGAELSMPATMFVCGATLADSRDGKNYPTVAIGSQCWMAKNLNYGTRINGTTEQTNNSIAEKYCYSNLESNCDVYGGLYQWGEMVQYLNGASNNTEWDPVPTGNVRGICPDKWHLPTTNELTTIINHLGGSSYAGGKMKQAGFSYWQSPNTGATNSSGFTALPGGNRQPNGSFVSLGTGAVFWAATTVTNWGTLDASLVSLAYNQEWTMGGFEKKTYGYSVRCLAD